MGQDDVFQMWTVFKNPKDFPGKYVARRFEVTRVGAKATNEIVVAAGLGAVRLALPPGLVRLKRDPSDDKAIIEVWI